MEKSKTFLSWWLFSFFSLASTFFIYKAGFFQDLYQNDQTKISFIILGLYVIMSFACGSNCKKIDTLCHPNENDKIKLNGMGAITKWFASSFTVLGMIGTVLGFIAAFKPLMNLDTNDAEMVQAMAADLSGGIMTAMYTTLVGMVCGMFLSFQNLIVNRAARKKIEGKVFIHSDYLETNRGIVFSNEANKPKSKSKKSFFKRFISKKKKRYG